MSCIETLPLTLPLSIYQGDTFNLSLTWNVDSAPVNLTGFTASMPIKNGATTVYTLTTSNSTIVLGGVLGTIVLSIDATDTATFPLITTGRYNLTLTSSGSEVTTLLVGSVNVWKE